MRMRMACRLTSSPYCPADTYTRISNVDLRLPDRFSPELRDLVRRVSEANHDDVELSRTLTLALIPRS